MVSGNATETQTLPYPMNYTCWTGFDAETEGVTTQVDDACIDFDNTLLGTRSCPGEP